MSVRMATCAKIRIYSADMERTLLRITQEGIILHQIRREDTLCAVVDVDFRNYRETLQLLERLHLQYDVLNKDITEPAYRRIFGRSVLILGFLLIFCLTILLPGRILFIYVNGNRAIPTRMILEAAGECGRVLGMGLKPDMDGRYYGDQLLGCAFSHFRRLGCKNLAIDPGWYPDDIVARYEFDPVTRIRNIDTGIFNWEE